MRGHIQPIASFALVLVANSLPIRASSCISQPCVPIQDPTQRSSYNQSTTNWQHSTLTKFPASHRPYAIRACYTDHGSSEKEHLPNTALASN
ncbi:uncharacterized protein BO72DRAFT_155785 [Aspergillus fijiensis CBS 313.89]|uniref:Secreted protein n=1 Tax=Aspergillus fijiensis CBS 313.89 TaxID=1448319 RepID=A0A8G1RPF7_9EURO|nr:uncharacterized protein BO72DRAFT_155785 [Aspergillus fijiensis CBS 313.89]RAK75908.1 hypothetical protein BO72DRAFT_155785 [Aspergillus fijiensis CBS 313.89]